MGNDDAIWANEIGDILLRIIDGDKARNIHLTHLLFVHKLGTNFTSIRKLCLTGCTTQLLSFDRGAQIVDRNNESTDLQRQCEGMVSAAVTAAVSGMIQGGIRHGYTTNGEAYL